MASHNVIERNILSRIPQEIQRKPEVKIVSNANGNISIPNYSSTLEKVPTSTEFYYLDPSGIAQGPFTKEKMYGWYSLNYFPDDLKVKRKEDADYKTLAELKIINGPRVFDYKTPIPPQPIAPTPHPIYLNNNVRTIWNDAFPSTIYNPTITPAFDEYAMLAEKQRFEQQKRREMEELIIKARQQVEEERKAAAAKEAEFIKKQELLREELMRKQMETLNMQKKCDALEAEKNARLEEQNRRHMEVLKKLEEKRKEHERMAQEEDRKREIARKQEEAERMRRAEQAAEEHRRRLHQKAEEDLAKIQSMAVIENARRCEEIKKAALDTEKMFNNEFQTESMKPKINANNLPKEHGVSMKKPVSQKAPWSTTSNSPRDKTLREIQEEEERQQAAEARERNRLRKESGSIHDSNLRCISGNKVLDRLAWNGAALNPVPVPSINWDGPTLQDANKSVRASTPQLKSNNTAKTSKKHNTEVQDLFSQWVIKRIKEINPVVDAEILCSFLADVENPNEVEDFIEGSIGTSKVAKEFVKEYLQKRSDSRKRKDVEKDDLSSAKQAGNASGTIQRKKKKGKNTRLVVDGSCLGFRAAADPNRINQGEIETVAFASGQKR